MTRQDAHSVRLRSSEVFALLGYYSV